MKTEGKHVNVLLPTALIEQIDRESYRRHLMTRAGMVRRIVENYFAPPEEKIEGNDRFMALCEEKLAAIERASDDRAAALERVIEAKEEIIAAKDGIIGDMRSIINAVLQERGQK